MKVVDGKAHFPIHEIVLADLTDEVYSLVSRFHFDYEFKTIVIYTKDELAEAKHILDKHEVSYQIEECTLLSVDDTIHFNNKQELIDYVKSGKVPDHEKLPRLEKENKELKDNMLAILFGNQTEIMKLKQRHAEEVFSRGWITKTEKDILLKK